jgi:hypothetical protein
MVRIKLRMSVINIYRIFFFSFLMIPAIVFGQPPEAETKQAIGLLNNIDIYAKVIGAILTGLGTLFGLPLVILNFRKTRAEIRKLELEASALQQKAAVTGDSESGTSIHISDSHDVNVQVLADPRFLGPLLLLLDFIFAWVLLTLAGYFLSLFGLGYIRTILLFTLAAVLLIPIAKEAHRVKLNLRPKDNKEGDGKSA